MAGIGGPPGRRRGRGPAAVAESITAPDSLPRTRPGSPGRRPPAGPGEPACESRSPLALSMALMISAGLTRITVTVTASHGGPSPTRIRPQGADSPGRRHCDESGNS
jgi:hypothetical protein